jgi:Ca2+-binding EF-hand superfamily protein
LLGQLTDSEMRDVHRFFMLLEHEHRQKRAEYGSEQEDALRRLFDMYDLDKSGGIDLHELIQGLSENSVISVDSYVPSEILQKIMATVDKDSNRQLDYEEFKNLFMEAF